MWILRLAPCCSTKKSAPAAGGLAAAFRCRLLHRLFSETGWKFILAVSTCSAKQRLFAASHAAKKLVP